MRKGERGGRERKRNKHMKGGTERGDHKPQLNHGGAFDQGWIGDH